MIKRIKYIIVIIGLALIGINNTNAFFVDTSTSSTNTFSAGSLDFRVLNTDGSEISGYIIDGVGFIPGSSVSGAVKIVNDGSLGFEYSISSTFSSGDSGLFNVLDVIVSVDSTVVYSGNLSSLSSLSLYSDPFDTIEITVTLPSTAGDAYQLQNCDFEFVVRGNQEGPVIGFWDEETFLGKVSTSDWTEPLISGLMLASPSDPNGIQVNWRTDENSTSTVEIGTTTSYGMVFPVGGDVSADNTSHSVVLSGLSLNTNYHLRVVSSDAYGNTSYSDDYEFVLRYDWYEIAPRGAIVINEIFANPIGVDAVPAPDGEWIELYNKGASSIDVAGWSICTLDSCVNINASITDTGLTTISSGGFLVVNFGGYEFLGNNGWEVVALYRPGIWGLRDLHWYCGTQEGKSIVRYPDGSNNWYDPIPSPGLPNNIDPYVPEDNIDEDENEE